MRFSKDASKKASQCDGLIKKRSYQKTKIKNAIIDKKKVAINISHDVLLSEFYRGRITQAAFKAGLCYQGLLIELSSNINPSFCEYIDTSYHNNDVRIIKKIDKATRLRDLRFEARSLLGDDRELLIYKILCNYQSPSMMEPINRKKQYHISETFRESLEILGENWFCS